MKNTLSIFAVVIFAISAQANAQSFEKSSATQKNTNGILDVVNKYAEALGCPFEPATAKDIAALTPVTPMTSSGSEAEFLVFWGGDIGCQGGSGTSMYHAALVKGNGSDFYVDPSRSSPVINLDFNTRFKDRLVGNTKNTIVVDAREFADGDANNCCPSLSFRYTLQVDKKGNWRTIGKKALPPKVY